MTSAEGSLNVITKDVPKELIRYLGPSIQWLEVDSGGWGNYRPDDKRKGDGPVAEIIRHIQDWIDATRNRRVCIQAGGNLGLYPKVYSNFFDKVITFEPDKISYNVLLTNTKAVPNISSFNKALSNINGWATLNIHNRVNNGTHTIVGVEDTYNEANAASVPTTTIDSLNLEYLDLLHLDVEGHESYILEGALNTILKCKPTIILEANNCGDFLSKLGYINKGKYQDNVFVPGEI